MAEVRTMRRKEIQSYVCTRCAVNISKKTFMWFLFHQQWPYLFGDCFMDLHNSDTDTDILTVVFSFLHPVPVTQILLFQPCIPLQWFAILKSNSRDTDGLADMIWGSGCPQPWCTTCESMHDPCSFPLSKNFRWKWWAHLAMLLRPWKITVGLWLEGACTTWGLLHRVRMQTLIPDFWRQPLFCVTAAAPVLDIVSSPGATVSQLLSAIDTAQTQALTGSVCGGTLSPDADLTLLPSFMLFIFRYWHMVKTEKSKKKKKTAVSALPFPDRNRKLAMLEWKTTQRGLKGPVGPPRTNFSLTMT